MFFAIAQEEVQEGGQLLSKKGTPILPESGEFSLGISAVPFFEYAGNIFNGTSNNDAPGFGFTDEFPMMITGKYMLDDKTAIRGIFRIGFGNTKEIGDVDDDANPGEFVEDTYKYSGMNIGIGAGYEKRRGKGRLQGLYGGQVLLTFQSNTDTYEYANAYSTTNLAPSRYDFGANDLGAAWMLEEKSGLGFGVGIQGFVGVEYFFAPKLSLSGEFTYGFGFNKQAKSSATYEMWDVANDVLMKQTDEFGGSSSFGLDTGIGAFLNLNFYF